MRPASLHVLALALVVVTACGGGPKSAALPGVVPGPNAADCYDDCMEGLQKKDPEHAALDPDEALATCRAARGSDEACASDCAVAHTKSAEQDTKLDVDAAHKTCASLCGG